jgi:hypothetical protein
MARAKRKGKVRNEAPYPIGYNSSANEAARHMTLGSHPQQTAPVEA